MANNSIWDLEEIQARIELFKQEERRVILMNYEDGIQVISLDELESMIATNSNKLEKLIQINAYDSMDNPMLKKDMILAYDDRKQKFVPKEFFSKVEVRNDDPPYTELFDGRAWIRRDLLN